MNSYKCLIADDNPMERDLLSLYLKGIEQIEIVAECADGVEALQVLAKEEIDIVFSDVEMPGLSGLNLVQTLRQMPVTVLISAHAEYAVDSYNLDVIDFIVKPLTRERLHRAVAKAIEYLEMKAAKGNTTEPDPLPKEDFFYIRESNDFVRLYFKEVAYIESMGNFSKIYTLDNKRHITLVNLKNLELQLPVGNFSRTHRQYVVNHHHITAISTEEIKLADRFVLPISQVYRQELIDRVVNKHLITRIIAK